MITQFTDATIPRTTRRASSAMLREIYFGLSDSHIQDAALKIWKKKNGNSEAVAAEAFVALERASQDVTEERRMTFAIFEDKQPGDLKHLFARAIQITEAEMERAP